MFLLGCWLAQAGDEIHLDLGGQIAPDPGSGMSIALNTEARLEGDKDGYLLGAARVDPGGDWIGRLGVGFDVFGGGEELELRFGLFGGFTGNALDRTVFARPTMGGELQFGGKVGRVYGFYRHLDGFSGMLEERLTENELRLGFALTEEVRVHGQYVTFNPGGDRLVQGFGLGAEMIW